MKIRTKLILSYAILLIIFFVISLVSYLSIEQWDKTAQQLLIIQKQSVERENLRKNLYKQIILARDFIDTDHVLAERLLELRQTSDDLMAKLKTNSNNTIELENIESLEESYIELEYVIEKIIQAKNNDKIVFELDESRTSLSEIVDEIFDEIVSLNHYYENSINTSIVNSTTVGNKTVSLIIVSMAIIMGFLIILMLLNRNWLVKPINSVNAVTAEISNGNFNARIEQSRKDEWGELGNSINHLARSLSTYEMQLRNQERILALGEVAAYTAHNLQNPIAGIKAAVQYLLRKEPTESSTRDSYQDILNSIDRLDLWIKRFLDFAKPLELKKEEADINQLLKQTIAMIVNKFHDESIKINFNYKEIPVVSVDTILLEQTFSVLLSNAFESGADQISVTTEITKDEEKFQFISIEIRDNGSGIDPKIKDRLFQAFVTTKPKGTGLGLAQARKIINLHYGSLKLHSETSKGTVVSVQLPIS